MSLYNQFGIGDSSLTNSTIVANESYDSVEGAYKMIEESMKNEHAIFEAVIGCDFAEAINGINPSAVTESQLESIQESTVGTIWAKVVDFIQKVGEKVMGIIKNLIKRVESVFIRDGKELVKKYEKDINVKANTGALSKMKFKYAAPKGTSIKTPGETALNGKIESVLKIANTRKEQSDSGNGHTVTQADRDFVKPYTEDEKTKYLEEALSSIISGSDAKSFAKDFDEAYFEDADEKEGLDSTLLAKIKEVLTSYKKASKDLKDAESKENKAIKKWENDAKKIMTAMNKSLEGTDVKHTAVWANGHAAHVISLTSIYSRVAGMYFSAMGTALKKDFAQSRAIFVKAATYSQKKSVDEQVELLQGVEEASNYEVEDMFTAVLA